MQFSNREEYGVNKIITAQKWRPLTLEELVTRTSAPRLEV